MVTEYSKASTTGTWEDVFTEIDQNKIKKLDITN